MGTSSWPPDILTEADEFRVAGGADRRLNACIGTQVPSDLAWSWYASGFGRAATYLAQQLETDEKFRCWIDELVYPIVFLYRHHFEMILKRIATEARVIQEQVRQPPSGHDIIDLWEDARTRTEAVFGDRCDLSQNEIVSRLFKSFGKIDPVGQALRYPVSNKGKKHLAEKSLINIKEFALVADRLIRYLAELADRLESEQEFRGISVWNDDAQ